MVAFVFLVLAAHGFLADAARVMKKAADLKAMETPPSSMKAVQQSSYFPCRGPTWSCISLKEDAPVPKPGKGQVLVQIKGTSVAPKEVECVEPICLAFPLAGRLVGPSKIPFRCTKKGETLGGTGSGSSELLIDGAGYVAAVGEGCSEFSVGDEVWGFFKGTYAEYALGSCDKVRPKPKSLSFIDAGTIPSSACAANEVFRKAGAPWKLSDNVTVVVTAGQGGTGFIAVQIAKLLGASRVITAASGKGAEMVKSFGVVDEVIDYHKQELFDALGNDTVDVVFDNIAAVGTADKAMHAIRPGGTFVLLTGGGKGQLSKDPKEGVTQIHFGIFAPEGGETLDLFAKGFDEGKLHPHTFDTYGLAEVPQAFTRQMGRGLIGKIAVVPDKKILSGSDHP